MTVQVLIAFLRTHTTTVPYIQYVYSDTSLSVPTYQEHCCVHPLPHSFRMPSWNRHMAAVHFLHSFCLYVSQLPSLEVETPTLPIFSAGVTSLSLWHQYNIYSPYTIYMHGLWHVCTVHAGIYVYMTVGCPVCV